MLCAPLASRECAWVVEPESEVACEGRRNVCVAPFARRALAAIKSSESSKLQVVDGMVAKRVTMLVGVDVG